MTHPPLLQPRGPRVGLVARGALGTMMQRGTMVVAVGITVVRAVEVGATFFVLTASVSLFHLMSILVPSVQVDHARNQTSPNG